LLTLYIACLEVPAYRLFNRTENCLCILSINSDSRTGFLLLRM